jgi:hypothetical protein
MTNIDSELIDVGLKFTRRRHLLPREFRAELFDWRPSTSLQQKLSFYISAAQGTTGAGFLSSSMATKTMKQRAIDL